LQYYGVNGNYLTLAAYLAGAPDQSPVTVLRQDTSGVTVGTFHVDDGTVSTNNGIFRYWSACQGGRFYMSWPGHANPTYFVGSIDNCHRVTDNFLLGVQFAGTTIVSSCYQASTNINASGAYRRTMTSAASIAAVLAGSGDKYYQDTANNIVWVQVMGGLPCLLPLVVGQDDWLYQTQVLVIS
jgi:hypothetical protein